MAIQKQKRTRKRTRKRTKAHQDTSSSPSALLNLPAEIRNAIYEYALTEPFGIVVLTQPGLKRGKTKPVMMTYGENERPINQLKYVNRQLYTETVGIEIQFNRVVFHSDVPGHADAIHGLFKFVQHSTRRHLALLTRVYLYESVHENFEPGQIRGWDSFDWLELHMDSIVKTLRLCAANPHLQVQPEVPRFGPVIYGNGACEPLQVLVVGIVLTWMFRGRNIAHVMAPRGTADAITDYEYLRSKVLGQHRDEVERIRGGAHNLRFVPEPWEWDEEKFRTAAEEEWDNKASVSLPDGVGIAEWVQHAWQCSIEGV